MFFVFAVDSCGVIGDETAENERMVDSINDLAYGYRYISLDTCEMYFEDALALSDNYSDGRHEALLNKAFVHYMRMDYDSAVAVYRDVLDNSKNELLKLVADVCMMRISMHTGGNKAFYDYRNSALLRVDWIEKEEEHMTVRQRRQWNSCICEFHLVSAEYFYALRQEDFAAEEIEQLKSSEGLFSADSVQLAKYYLMRSVNDLLMTNEGGDDLRFKSIVQAYMTAKSKGLAYLQAKAMQLLSSELVKSDSIKPFRIDNIKRMMNVGGVDNDVLPLFLAQETQRIAREYGSLYLESLSYLTISDYYFYKEENDSAIAYVESALGCINEHHSMVCNSGDVLLPYSDVKDSVSTEMLWIRNPEIIVIPEWMAMVRERFSMCYSAAGRKMESDYNRNVYLDILDETRQDMKMQQRLDALAKEESELDVLLVILLICGTVLSIVAVFAWRKQQRMAKLRSKRFSVALSICKKLTSGLSVCSDSSDDVETALRKYVDSDVRGLFPNVNSDWSCEGNTLGAFDRELLSVINEFYAWAVNTVKMCAKLDDFMDEMEGERYLYSKRIVDKKRDNVDKLTCLSIVNGIMPFLDRVINEVAKLDNGGDVDLQKRRLVYVKELIEKINEYNEIITKWVKIKHGAITLNVESFRLQPMFDTLQKSKPAYDAKNISLDVKATDSVVKADAALTFFMMNTLMDNARKYTNEGGAVVLGADEGDDYVEIYVKDTGRGLTEKDISCILHDKVYDSSKIGDVDYDSELKKNKGHGFGLMSCLGIIEKYKKTSPFFSVCRFDIDSKLGEGSRFSFRLPKGIVRFVTVLFAVTSLLSSCADSNTVGIVDEETDTIDVMFEEADYLLDQASYYADAAYFCNKEQDFELTLVYVDSALMCLNSFNAVADSSLYGRLVLDGHKDMPEIDMWNDGFDTDYHVLLDLRNEASVAALALKRWDTYHYNNEIYTRLYKLMSQDDNLEEYCDAIHKANVNKQTFIGVLILIFVVSALVYFVLYYTTNYLPTLNMRQLILFYRKMFSFSEFAPVLKSDCEAENGWSDAMTDHSSMKYYEDFAEAVCVGFENLINVDGIGLLVDEPSGNSVATFSRKCPEKDYLQEQMNLAYKNDVAKVGSDKRYRAYPLVLDNDGDLVKVGVLGVVFRNASMSNHEELMVQLIVQFAAINIYYNNQRIQLRLADIEILDDQRRRVKYEENLIHVQNQVLDNCLSTIKHETMFYPNRIRQIVDEMLASGTLCKGDDVAKMRELVQYYKETFTLLLVYASRQLDNVMFKRKVVEVDKLSGGMHKVFERMRRKKGQDLTLNVQPNSGLCVLGDENMLEYLFYNLVMSMFDSDDSGDVEVNFEMSDGFVIFAITDRRNVFSQDELDVMFYPDALNATDDVKSLRAMRLLICKQIIREHDEHVGNRGCRIYSELLDNACGYRIVFSLPAKRA